MANLSNINNILRTGSLGVGINRDPLGAFEISSATKPGIKMFNTAASGKTYEAYSDINGNYIIFDQDANDNRFVINTSGNATFAGNVDITSGIIELGQNKIDGSSDNLKISADFGGVSGSSTIEFLVDGSEKMRINNSGNVGIGNGNPQNKLDIEQSAAVSARLLATGATSSSLKLEVKGGATQLTTTEILANSSGTLTFATGTTSSTERMRIDSSGLVSIKNVEVPTLRLENTDTSLGVQTLGSLEYYQSDPSATGVGVVSRINCVNESGFQGAAALTFETGDVSSITERMRITSSGQVNMTKGSSGTVLYLDGVNAYDAETGIQLSAGRAKISGFLNPTGGTPGSSLRFYTMPDNGSVTERMRIASGGNVLFGKTSQGLSIVGIEAASNNTLRATKTNSAPVEFNRTGTSGDVVLFYANTGGVGSISVTQSSTYYNTSSDYRLKEDLKDFAGLDMVSKIPVYDFKWKSDKSRSYGVVAHELQEVLPDAVSGEKDAEEMQGVDYSKIVPLLVKSIQELKADNDSLKARIETLENN